MIDMEVVKLGQHMLAKKHIDMMHMLESTLDSASGASESRL